MTLRCPFASAAVTRAPVIVCVRHFRVRTTLSCGRQIKTRPSGAVCAGTHPSASCRGN
ncbi:hypothetical protein NP493_989g00004 [Ridgeia piscesae]|uniref:Uncharacterized protein n=1 Tax=Ridgeia piscesae TaxID=27915 RepID=A0AAD9KID5_RIDPI|nr:hypothetical protein NP493_989g00004 [Ridgeia piscesae]